MLLNSMLACLENQHKAVTAWTLWKDSFDGFIATVPAWEERDFLRLIKSLPALPEIVIRTHRTRGLQFGPLHTATYEHGVQEMGRGDICAVTDDDPLGLPQEATDWCTQKGYRPRSGKPKEYRDLSEKEFRMIVNRDMGIAVSHGHQLLAYTHNRKYAYNKAQPELYSNACAVFINKYSPCPFAQTQILEEVQGGLDLLRQLGTAPYWKNHRVTFPMHVRVRLTGFDPVRDEIESQLLAERYNGCRVLTSRSGQALRTGLAMRPVLDGSFYDRP